MPVSLTLTRSGVIVWVRTVGRNRVKSRNLPAVAKYPTDSLSIILPIITWSIFWYITTAAPERTKGKDCFKK